MPGLSSPTIGDAFNGLGQKQNQIVLDGGVATIYEDGSLVTVSRGLAFVTPTPIDHHFRAGESVILARSKDDRWVAIGVGETGVLASLPGISTTVPPIVSQTLHESVVRLIAKNNRVVETTHVATIYEDGSIAAQLPHGPAILNTSPTTQIFSVGQPVFAMKHDDDTWLALGSPLALGATRPPVVMPEIPKATRAAISAPTVPWARTAMITVTVSDASGGGGMPTGLANVFVDDNGPFTGPLINGVAVISVPGVEAYLFSPYSSAPGEMLESVTHTIRAEYVPNSGWAPSITTGSLVVTDSTYAQLLSV